MIDYNSFYFWFRYDSDPNEPESLKNVLDYKIINRQQNRLTLVFSEEKFIKT